MKRLMDIALAVILLIALSPLLAVIALLVRFNLGSPILFRQKRPGFGGKPFLMCKFRTMRNARNAKNEILNDEERRTWFGNLLRKLSLDELPELWNVLIGNMSFVGPRPLLMSFLPHYTPEQARRHDVRPGITGWAQINGRNKLSWDEKLAFDIWYVDHQSLWLDFRILCGTAAIVLGRKGIDYSANCIPASMAHLTSGEIMSQEARL
ncbi:sugar transferase [Anatilimnocola floriformis]|uniref:sugar transferase n=1 Tax=Anatilimnocola floriformis TaxID=2948575 RepID=UPI0020C36D9D|nr:sugar transferase [Anatilimnocola floriformis]